MKTLQGQRNVSFPLPTAWKGRKPIKIACNLFVSLEEKKVYLVKVFFFFKAGRLFSP